MVMTCRSERRIKERAELGGIKRMRRIAGIVLAVLGIAATVFGMIFKKKGQMVIGGADGPTSVFVAGKVGGTSAAAGIVAGIVLLAVGIFMIARKK